MRSTRSTTKLMRPLPSLLRRCMSASGTKSRRAKGLNCRLPIPLTNCVCENRPSKGITQRGKYPTGVFVQFLDDKGVGAETPAGGRTGFLRELEPGEQVIPVKGGGSTSVKVGVNCNLTGAPKGTLHLEAPSGWRFEPSRTPGGIPPARREAGLSFQSISSQLEGGPS